MKKNKITEIHGYGRFTDAHTLSVDLNDDGGSQEITFDNAIIATGASTRLVPGTSLSENVVTYEKQILTRELPKSIIVAGAGAIGMEFGYVLKNYGVDVTIVEFLPRALPNEDADVSKEIEKQFKKLGVKILTGTKVESITDDGSEVTVAVSKDGKSQELKAEKVLQAIGFAPNVEGYGLDKAGVALTDRKAIGIDRLHADQRARTSTPSATSPASCSWPTSPRPRVWWRPKPSRAQRLWRSVTTA